MNDSTTRADLPSPGTSQPPGLSRRQMLLLFVLVTLGPFALVVLLYFATPDHRDPELKAQVELGSRAWPSQSAPNAQLVPCIVLRNPTDEPWGNVNLSINDQYFFYYPEPIPPGGEIVVPLKFFHTKGATRYHPETWPLKTLTVYAQLPSGTRAIAEFTADEILPSSSTDGSTEPVDAGTT